MAADNRRVGADGRAALHHGFKVLVSLVHIAAWICNVREYYRRTAKDVVLYFDAIINGNVILNFEFSDFARNYRRITENP